MAERSVARLVSRGVYDGHRAAALSGVPYSTVQYWAREGPVLPSISPERVRYWSWLDLVKLRGVYWLRQHHRVPMSKVRAALEEIDRVGLGDRALDSGILFVSWSGEVFLKPSTGVVYHAAAGRQGADPDVLDLVEAFETGPHLTRPREHLRIVPGKLTGEPHVEGTRVSTLTLYALHRAGYERGFVQEQYPGVPGVAIDEAIELEAALAVAA